MPNLALMKLASWHRAKGDDVTILDMSGQHYDRIYASKVFAGGSGYDIKSRLPEEIELQTPDYELFKTDYSIGFTSRGCIRDCGFCIVRDKEGDIHEADTNWIKHQKVMALDNNFLASPKWKEKLEQFIRDGNRVCFSQGLDIRLVNEENAQLLAKLKYYDFDFAHRRLYFSFDDPKLRDLFVEKIKILKAVGIPARHMLIFILVGYNTTFEQDYARFKTVTDLVCLSFVTVYNNRRDRTLLRCFARWVNGVATR